MFIHMCQCIQMYIMCVFMTYYVYTLMYKLPYENINIYVNVEVKNVFICISNLLITMCSCINIHEYALRCRLYYVYIYVAIAE